MGAFWWIVGIILAALMVMVGFLSVRFFLLSRQQGSFPSMLRVTEGPGSEQGWKRGFACYGQTNMAWSGLARLSVSPDLLLPRSSLELYAAPLHDPETGTSTLFLGDEERKYEMVLSTGDYEGLVSWVASSPPGVN